MFIGIDVGGTKCAVVSSEKDGIIKEKIRFVTENKENTIKRIVEAVESMGAADAIGISCGGPLDEENGVILSPPNLPGWDRVEIVNMLKEHFSVPVKIRNDANACALAEWRFGAGKGYDNVIFLTCGTGFGGGLILNGKLYSGSTGNAGEIGHVRLSDHGPAGYGKIGSVEGFCSGTGIREVGRMMAREAMQRGERPLFLKRKTLDTFDASDLADAARMGDETAKEVFLFCGRMLGRSLAILCDILDPQVIIIGSVYARCRDLLEDPTINELKKEALAFTAKCSVTVPVLGEQIGDMAALAVAMEAYDELR